MAELHALSSGNNNLILQLGYASSVLVASYVLYAGGAGIPFVSAGSRKCESSQEEQSSDCVPTFWRSCPKGRAKNAFFLEQSIWFAALAVLLLNFLFIQCLKWTLEQVEKRRMEVEKESEENANRIDQLEKESKKKLGKIEELEKEIGMTSSRAKELEEEFLLKTSRIEELETAIEVTRAKPTAEPFKMENSALLAMLGQEVRTPLTGILGIVQLLQTSPLGPFQHDLVRTAEMASRGLIHIINNALDLSLLDSSSLTLSSLPFDIRSMLDDVLGLFGPEASEKGLELAALVMDSVPNTLLGDPVRVRQVLYNLLGTALQFTNHGHIFVCIRILAPEEESPSLSSSSPTTGAEDELDAALATRSSIQAGSSHSRTGSIQGGLSDTVSDPGSLADGSQDGQGSPSWASQVVRQSLPVRTDLGRQREGIFPTLSGVEAVDDRASWGAISHIMEEQEQRYRRLLARPDHGQGAQQVRLVVTVEDTGEGLPAEVQQHLWEPFSAAIGGVMRRFAGARVSLAVSQRLVALMGGQLTVLSYPGVGTTVQFDLEIDVPPRPTSKSTTGGALLGEEQQQDFAANRAKLRGMRALVVDGQSVRQQVVATYLARLGMRVDLSDSLTAAALALRQAMGLMTSSSSSPSPFPQTGIHSSGARRTKPYWDIIVVDADSDGPATGIELGRMVQQMKELQPRIPGTGGMGGGLGGLGGGDAGPLPQPRLVLVAKQVDEDVEAEAARNGFVATIAKPVRAVPLVSGLLRALGGTTRDSTAMAVKRRQMLLRMTLKDKKIMVVDENFVSRKAAALTLSKYAEVTLAVENGREALVHLQPPHDFDLVLLDTDMTQLSACEVSTEIRKREEEDRERLWHKYGSKQQRPWVPIIGLVQDPGVEASRVCEAAGMVDAIGKPLDEDSLMTAAIKIFEPPQSVGS